MLNFFSRKPGLFCKRIQVVCCGYRLVSQGAEPGDKTGGGCRNPPEFLPGSSYLAAELLHLFSCSNRLLFCNASEFLILFFKVFQILLCCDNLSLQGIPLSSAFLDLRLCIFQLCQPFFCGLDRGFKLFLLLGEQFRIARIELKQLINVLQVGLCRF